MARYIAESRKDACVLLVSGSGIIHAVKIPKGIDYIKLPSVTKIGDDRYGSKYLPLTLKEIIKLREKILLDTALFYKPDVFVIDNVPLGLKGEAKKTIKTLKKVRPACKIVLTMRDILDDAEKIRKVWKKGNIYGMIDRYFDSILVFGLRDVYDTVEEYEIPDNLASKFMFCGYINRAQNLISPRKIRAKLDINGHRFILVTAGGGRDGVRFIEATLKGLERFRNGMFKSLVVLGPDFPEDKERKLRSRYGEQGNFVIKDFVDNLPDFINASDLVISMGGYNTVSEILSLKKRAIVVPRVKPRVEQLMRAKILSHRGLLEYIHPSMLHPDVMKDKIEEQLLNSKSPRSFIDFDGLRRSLAIFDKLFSS